MNPKWVLYAQGVAVLVAALIIVCLAYWATTPAR